MLVLLSHSKNISSVPPVRYLLGQDLEWNLTLMILQKEGPILIQIFTEMFLPCELMHADRIVFTFVDSVGWWLELVI